MTFIENNLLIPLKNSPFRPIISLIPHVKIKENMEHFTEEDYKKIPKNGVYVVQTYIDEKVVFGMMNIGFNPTVNGEKQTIEVHLFDFDADIYGQKIEVSLLTYLREEQKFGSVDLLKEQLNLDQTNALAFIRQL